MTFKVGDKVKIVRKYSDNDECTWVSLMDKTVNQYGEITRLIGKNSAYVEVGDITWVYDKSSLELVKDFDPKPGDTIVCKNGKEFTCVKREDYRYLSVYPDSVIYSVCEGSHMNWKHYDGICKIDRSYNIDKIIPAKIPEPAVYSVRQVAEAIHEVTGVPKQSDFESKVELINKHLSKVNDPEWKEYQRLREKFNA